MSKGVLLFAFNNGITNYYDMAVATAKRVNHFLNLPVSIVTDINSLPVTPTYEFDKLFVVQADSSNKKDRKVWINKGRYQAYDLSPYDETLLLDTDYLINSNQLLKIFDIYDDFMCPNRTYFLMNEHGHQQEQVSVTSFNTLWATIIAFKKTNKAKQIFDCMYMIQENYTHYLNIYNMHSSQFRNDHALAISCRIVNGHLEDKSMYMPWALTHINTELIVEKLTNSVYNTSYKIYKKNQKTSKPEYCVVNNMDFHLMNKNMFMEIV